MKVVIESGMEVCLSGAGGFVSVGPTGVTIQGTMVLINSGGAAVPGSPGMPESPQSPSDPTAPTAPTFPGDAPPSASNKK
jgi:type VI secretion system secreted protein VgrG